MRNLKYLVLLLLFTCNGEDAHDCFQKTGHIIQETVNVISFQRILVNRNIELIIKEASDYKVIVETGENLINDVTVEVIGDRLVLSDNNTCNYVRDYGITKIYVEAPNLSEIRTSSQYEVSSEGILNFENLSLFSEDFYETNEFTVGDFRLSVNAQNVTIGSNNLSFFYLNGSAENLVIGFFSGSSRFEGANLVAQHVNVSHRSSNDMVINPIQSLSGRLRGTGNVIAVNQPPVVNVDQIYTGQLIFN